MKTIAQLVAAAALGVAAATAAEPGPFETDAALTPENQIDQLVLARLGQLGIQPAPLCSDAVFVRRAYLDVLGTIPTDREAREFLLNQDADKRRGLIDRLLTRDEFADYWAMKWGDLLRVKAEFPIKLWPNAAQAYHRWIRASLRENQPYDRFVREMLTSSGSSFYRPQVNFYRAMQNKDPEGIATSVALTFMGARAEKWPKERLEGMAAFFRRVRYKSTAEWKEEIVYVEVNEAATTGAGPAPPAAVFPDGTPAVLTADGDPREVFADWLLDPKNPWFARAIVNRVWYWLLGHGIIHEPDDLRPDNPPSNPELLAWLERQLVAARYDLKHVFRLILNSKTYQLSCIPRTDRLPGEAHFAYYPLRRLEAEVLIDLVNQITGTGEFYQSQIPEPYTFMPRTRRTIELPDGSITSPFLEKFGRPSRMTGMESERDNRLTGGQRLHLLNSSHILSKMKGITDRLRRQFPDAAGQPPSETVMDEKTKMAYLTILSRLPTQEELTIAREYGSAFREDALAWALINSVEFLCRH